jgi:predicted ATPase
MTSIGWLLNLDEIRYVGRSEELSRLCEIADAVDRLKQRKIVFICGESGSGKTSLWKEFQTINFHVPFLVSGKFEEFNSQQPYSAIKEAFSDLCNQIGASDNIGIIRQTLRDALGSEDAILRNAIPECHHIIGTEMELSSNVIELKESFTFHRLKLSLRALLKASLSAGQTVIMCLDDIQWADEESWDLIQYLLKDITLNNFMFIGIIRAKQIESWRSDFSSFLSQISDANIISLNNFDIHQVNELVSSLLHMPQEETISLATIIYAKCRGNPYFSIQMLKIVEKQKLLWYSMVDFRWEWDIGAIQVNTDIGDNLVDSFLLKINGLPVNTRKLLTFASCLGGKFDASLLERLFRTDYLSDFVEKSILDNYQEDLNVALQEGVIERHKDTTIYRFVHDKIQQAFSTLAAEMSRPEALHLALGRALLFLIDLKTSNDQSLLFLTANQLNRCLHLISNNEEKVVVAELNLLTAKAAIQSSAFQPASDFLLHGLQLLDEELKSHVDLQLEILVLLAGAQLCLGRLSDCLLTVDDVLTKAQTVKERLRVFQICIDAYAASSELALGVQTGLRFLKELGVRVPKKFNKLTFWCSYIKAKKMIKGKKECDFMNYKLANEPYYIAAMKIISALVHFTFQSEMVEVMATLICINAALSFKYGFTNETGSILGNFGLILAFVGNFSEGYFISQTCLKLTEGRNISIPCSVILNHFSCFYHQRHPLRSCLEPLLQGYKLGFEVGDTFNGFHCCLLYLEIFYYVGLPLPNLLQDIKSFSKEMEDYNMQLTLKYLNVYHQSVLNLTSEIVLEDPTNLSGSVMTEELVLNSGIKKVVGNFWFAKLIIAVHFQNVRTIQQCLEVLSFRRNFGEDWCMYYKSTCLLYEGIGAFILAQKTRKRKYSVLARKRTMELKQWNKKGNVNCYHSWLHLEAESAALCQQPIWEIKEKYDSAISSARRAGLCNAAALACERAALYFLGIQDHEQATLYMLASYEMYECWGATSKCRMMVYDYPNLLSDLRMSYEYNHKSHSTGTSHLGRIRHTSTERLLHLGENLIHISESINVSNPNDTSR